MSYVAEGDIAEHSGVASEYNEPTEMIDHAQNRIKSLVEPHMCNMREPVPPYGLIL
jgi:hypothetical protein